MALKNEKKLKLCLLLAAVIALAVFLFLMLYNYDNKYTHRGPQPVDGILMLDEESLERYPLMFLVNGWEYYGGRLLTPDEYESESLTPDQIIYIGQYGGFEAGDINASPHGSATYRLNIIIPDSNGEYTLELPEIFSAYIAYINGREVMHLGDTDPGSYRPETGNRTISIEASGNIEIIIAVSDFSYLYSGMTYPPVFGTPEAVSSLLGNRLALRSIVCAVALTIALLSALIGIIYRKKPLLWQFSLLCISFVGYVSYPVIQTLWNGFQPFYAIENFSFCAMLLITMWIQYRIFGEKNKWCRYFICFGIACCATSLILPLLLPSGSLTVMYVYSYLISVYEWVTAAFITFTAIRAMIRSSSSSVVLLCGIMFFNCALVMDRLLPLFEPIYTGWFIEIASFVLVLSVGIVIGQDVAGKLAENAVLTEKADNMEKFSEIQQSYFSELKQEMGETKEMQHDMRHHFAVIDTMLKKKQLEELTKYITGFSDISLSNETKTYSDNNIINILAHHYSELSKQNRIHFEMRCEIVGEIHVSDTDLCTVLSNLMENAMEACLRILTGRRFIRLAITDLGDDLIINVENTTTDSVKEKGDSFISDKGSEREGYGLRSIRTITKKYDGTVKFSWDKEKRRFTSLVIL